jgi:hypothetical protein
VRKKYAKANVDSSRGQKTSYFHLFLEECETKHSYYLDTRNFIVLPLPTEKEWHLKSQIYRSITGDIGLPCACTWWRTNIIKE